MVGGHPHVIQDAEIYKEKLIFYSHGSLLFDQTFSEETQRGLIITGKILEGMLMELILLPTISQKYKSNSMGGEEKADIITKFHQFLGYKTNERE